MFKITRAYVLSSQHSHHLPQYYLPKHHCFVAKLAAAPIQLVRHRGFCWKACRWFHAARSHSPLADTGVARVRKNEAGRILLNQVHKLAAHGKVDAQALEDPWPPFSDDSLSDWELDSSRRLKADLLSRSEVDHAPCGTSLKGDGNVAKSSGWLWQVAQCIRNRRCWVRESSPRQLIEAKKLQEDEEGLSGVLENSLSMKVGKAGDSEEPMQSLRGAT